MDSGSHNKPTKHHQPSSGELLSSAKLVAEAAKATLQHETNKVDKVKVAGAAEDLLGAASRYGKLEEKSYGRYVEKAENYLHQYHTSHSTTTATASSGHSATGTTHTSAHTSGGNEEQSGSGYGEYLKIAQGFLKKN